MYGTRFDIAIQARLTKKPDTRPKVTYCSAVGSGSMRADPFTLAVFEGSDPKAYAVLNTCKEGDEVKLTGYFRKPEPGYRHSYFVVHQAEVI